MELHVGLDVALDSTSVCIVNELGTKLLETSVASEPEAICLTLKDHVGQYCPDRHRGILNRHLAGTRVARRRPAGDRRRDPAHALGTERDAQEDRSQ
jgi:hypothetical protein